MFAVVFTVQLGNLNSHWKFLRVNTAQSRGSPKAATGQPLDRLPRDRPKGCPRLKSVQIQPRGQPLGSHPPAALSQPSGGLSSQPRGGLGAANFFYWGSFSVAKPDAAYFLVAVIAAERLVESDLVTEVERWSDARKRSFYGCM